MICSALPVQLALYLVEEFGRAKKILSGVTLASALYPDSVVAMAVVGMLKGSGKKWGITWYRLVYQPQSASVMELKKLSFITKVAAVLALTYSLNTQMEFCPQHQLLMMAGLLLVFLRYHSLLVTEIDYIDPLLHIIWSLATILSIDPPPPPPPISAQPNSFSSKDTSSGSPDNKEVEEEHIISLKKKL